MEIGTILMIGTFALWGMRAIQKATHNIAVNVIISLIALIAFSVAIIVTLVVLHTTDVVWAIMFGMWCANVIVGDRSDGE